MYLFYIEFASCSAWYFVEAKYNSTAFNYLVKERGIEKEIVNRLFKEKYLIQDKYNNVIFNWTIDGKPPLQQHHIIGATQQLTKQPAEGQPSKYIKSASEKDFGFNIQLGNRTEQFYIFEAGIDLLSYWSIHKNELNNCRLVSMEGASKVNTIYKFLSQEYDKGNQSFQVYLGVDNDKAGFNLLANIRRPTEESQLQFIDNIPDFNVIERSVEQTLRQLSVEYNVPFSEVTSIYLAERHYLQKATDKEKETLYYSDGLKTGVQQLSQKLKEYPFHDFIRGERQFSLWHKEQITHWHQLIEKEQLVVKEVVLKDWNDVLNREEIAVKKEITVEKQPVELTVEQRVKTNYQRLSESSQERVHQAYGIDSDIVTLFANKGWIRESKEDKTLALVWGKNGNVVGAETLINGKVKEIPGSSKEDSFIFTIGEPKNIYVFDSSIEALSFFNLHRHLQDAVFIASNQHPNYLLDKINDYMRSTAPTQINLCTSSERSESLHHQIAQQYKAEGRLFTHQGHAFIVHDYVPIGKNWQSDLKCYQEYSNLKKQIDALQLKREYSSTPVMEKAHTL